MDKKTLKRLAGKCQIPVGTLEKDYALTSLLTVIANFPKLTSMVFKGGTAIKKIHFDEFRFSEDLDFTCLKDISKELMDPIKEKMKTLDVEFTEIEETESREDGKQFKIKYNDFNKHENSIKIDLSLRKDILKEKLGIWSGRA